MESYKKPDYWSLKAQKEDYPARSVYKLKEIDDKFHFFTSAPRINTTLRILDLGAAPGSWSLYIIRSYGKDSRLPLFIAAADLLPLSQRNDFFGDIFFIQGDFTGNMVREELVCRGPYSAIISDAAPATTGSRTVDTLRSLTLAEEVLFYAENCLIPGGNLAIKIFQGGDAAELLKRVKTCFNSAKSFKPSACRNSSFETYYVGLGKK